MEEIHEEQVTTPEEQVNVPKAENTNIVVENTTTPSTVTTRHNNESSLIRQILTTITMLFCHTATTPETGNEQEQESDFDTTSETSHHTNVLKYSVSYIKKCKYYHKVKRSVRRRKFYESLIIYLIITICLNCILLNLCISLGCYKNQETVEPTFKLEYLRDILRFVDEKYQKTFKSSTKVTPVNNNELSFGNIFLLLLIKIFSLFYNIVYTSLDWILTILFKLYSFTWITILLPSEIFWFFELFYPNLLADFRKILIGFMIFYMTYYLITRLKRQPYLLPEKIRKALYYISFKKAFCLHGLHSSDQYHINLNKPWQSYIRRPIANEILFGFCVYCNSFGHVFQAKNTDLACPIFYNKKFNERELYATNNFNKLSSYFMYPFYFFYQQKYEHDFFHKIPVKAPLFFFLDNKQYKPKQKNLYTGPVRYATINKNLNITLFDIFDNQKYIYECYDNENLDINLKSTILENRNQIFNSIIVLPNYKSLTRNILMAFNHFSIQEDTIPLDELIDNGNGFDMTQYNKVKQSAAEARLKAKQYIKIDNYHAKRSTSMPTIPKTSYKPFIPIPRTPSDPVVANPYKDSGFKVTLKNGMEIDIPSENDHTQTEAKSYSAAVKTDTAHSNEERLFKKFNVNRYGFINSNASCWINAVAHLTPLFDTSSNAFWRIITRNYNESCFGSVDLGSNLSSTALPRGINKLEAITAAIHLMSKAENNGHFYLSCYCYQCQNAFEKKLTVNNIIGFDITKDFISQLIDNNTQFNCKTCKKMPSFNYDYVKGGTNLFSVIPCGNFNYEPIKLAKQTLQPTAVIYNTDTARAMLGEITHYVAYRIYYENGKQFFIKHDDSRRPIITDPPVMPNFVLYEVQSESTRIIEDILDDSYTDLNSSIDDSLAKLDNLEKILVNSATNLQNQAHENAIAVTEQPFYKRASPSISISSLTGTLDSVDDQTSTVSVHEEQHLAQDNIEQQIKDKISSSITIEDLSNAQDQIEQNLENTIPSSHEDIYIAQDIIEQNLQDNTASLEATLEYTANSISDLQKTLETTAAINTLPLSKPIDNFKNNIKGIKLLNDINGSRNNIDEIEYSTNLPYNCRKFPEAKQFITHAMNGSDLHLWDTAVQTHYCNNSHHPEYFINSSNASLNKAQRKFANVNNESKEMFCDLLGCNMGVALKQFRKDFTIQNALYICKTWPNYKYIEHFVTRLNLEAIEPTKKLETRHIPGDLEEKTLFEDFIRFYLLLSLANERVGSDKHLALFKIACEQFDCLSNYLIDTDAHLRGINVVSKNLFDQLYPFHDYDKYYDLMILAYCYRWNYGETILKFVGKSINTIGLAEFLDTDLKKYSIDNLDTLSSISASTNFLNNFTPCDPSFAVQRLLSETKVYNPVITTSQTEINEQEKPIEIPIEVKSNTLETIEVSPSIQALNTSTNVVSNIPEIPSISIEVNHTLRKFKSIFDEPDTTVDEYAQSERDIDYAWDDNYDVNNEFYSEEENENEEDDFDITETYVFNDDKEIDNTSKEDLKNLDTKINTTSVKPLSPILEIHEHEVDEVKTSTTDILNLSTNSLHTLNCTDVPTLDTHLKLEVEVSNDSVITFTNDKPNISNSILNLVDNLVERVAEDSMNSAVEALPIIPIEPIVDVPTSLICDPLTFLLENNTGNDNIIKPPVIPTPPVRPLDIKDDAEERNPVLVRNKPKPINKQPTKIPNILQPGYREYLSQDIDLNLSPNYGGYNLTIPHTYLKNEPNLGTNVTSGCLSDVSVYLLKQFLDTLPEPINKPAARREWLFSNAKHYSYKNGKRFRKLLPDGKWSVQLQQLLSSCLPPHLKYTRFNSLLIVGYEGAESKLNLHQDNETIHSHDTVFTISLGAPGTLYLKDAEQHTTPDDFTNCSMLTTNSCSWYALENQNTYYHGVRNCGPRLALTFRCFKGTIKAEDYTLQGPQDPYLEQFTNWYSYSGFRSLLKIFYGGTTIHLNPNIHRHTECKLINNEPHFKLNILKPHLKDKLDKELKNLTIHTKYPYAIVTNSKANVLKGESVLLEVRLPNPRIYANSVVAIIDPTLTFGYVYDGKKYFLHDTYIAVTNYCFEAVQNRDIKLFFELLIKYLSINCSDSIKDYQTALEYLSREKIVNPYTFFYLNSWVDIFNSLAYTTYCNVNIPEILNLKLSESSLDLVETLQDSREKLYLSNTALNNETIQPENLDHLSSQNENETKVDSNTNTTNESNTIPVANIENINNPKVAKLLKFFHDIVLIEKAIPTDTLEQLDLMYVGKIDNNLKKYYNIFKHGYKAFTSYILYCYNRTRYCSMAVNNTTDEYSQQIFVGLTKEHNVIVKPIACNPDKLVQTNYTVINRNHDMIKGSFYPRLATKLLGKFITLLSKYSWNDQECIDYLPEHYSYFAQQTKQDKNFFNKRGPYKLFRSVINLYLRYQHIEGMTVENAFYDIMTSSKRKVNLKNQDKYETKCSCTNHYSYTGVIMNNHNDVDVDSRLVRFRTSNFRINPFYNIYSNEKIYTNYEIFFCNLWNLIYSGNLPFSVLDYYHDRYFAEFNTKGLNKVDHLDFSELSANAKLAKSFTLLPDGCSDQFYTELVIKDIAIPEPYDVCSETIGFILNKYPSFYLKFCEEFLDEKPIELPSTHISNTRTEVDENFNRFNMPALNSLPTALTFLSLLSGADASIISIGTINTTKFAPVLYVLILSFVTHLVPLICIAFSLYFHYYYIKYIFGNRSKELEILMVLFFILICFILCTGIIEMFKIESNLEYIKDEIQNTMHTESILTIVNKTVNTTDIDLYTEVKNLTKEIEIQPAAKLYIDIQSLLEDNVTSTDDTITLPIKEIKNISDYRTVSENVTKLEAKVIAEDPKTILNQLYDLKDYDYNQLIDTNQSCIFLLNDVNTAPELTKQFVQDTTRYLRTGRKLVDYSDFTQLCDFNSVKYNKCPIFYSNIDLYISNFNAEDLDHRLKLMNFCYGIHLGATFRDDFKPLVYIDMHLTQYDYNTRVMSSAYNLLYDTVFNAEDLKEFGHNGVYDLHLLQYFDFVKFSLIPNLGLTYRYENHLTQILYDQCLRNNHFACRFLKYYYYPKFKHTFDMEYSDKILNLIGKFFNTTDIKIERATLDIVHNILSKINITITRSSVYGFTYSYSTLFFKYNQTVNYTYNLLYHSYTYHPSYLDQLYHGLLEFNPLKPNTYYGDTWIFDPKVNKYNGDPNSLYYYHPKYMNGGNCNLDSTLTCPYITFTPNQFMQFLKKYNFYGIAHKGSWLPDFDLSNICKTEHKDYMCFDQYIFLKRYNITTYTYEDIVFELSETFKFDRNIIYNNLYTNNFLVTSNNPQTLLLFIEKYNLPWQLATSAFQQLAAVRINVANLCEEIHSELFDYSLRGYCINGGNITFTYTYRDGSNYTITYDNEPLPANLYHGISLLINYNNNLHFKRFFLNYDSIWSYLGYNVCYDYDDNREYFCDEPLTEYDSYYKNFGYIVRVQDNNIAVESATPMPYHIFKIYYATSYYEFLSFSLIGLVYIGFVLLLAVSFNRKFGSNTMLPYFVAIMFLFSAQILRSIVYVLNLNVITYLYRLNIIFNFICTFCLSTDLTCIYFLKRSDRMLIAAVFTTFYMMLLSMFYFYYVLAFIFVLFVTYFYYQYYYYNRPWEKDMILTRVTAAKYLHLYAPTTKPDNEQHSTNANYLSRQIASASINNPDKKKIEEYMREKFLSTCCKILNTNFKQETIYYSVPSLQTSTVIPEFSKQRLEFRAKPLSCYSPVISDAFYNHIFHIDFNGATLYGWYNNGSVYILRHLFAQDTLEHMKTIFELKWHNINITDRYGDVYKPIGYEIPSNNSIVAFKVHINCKLAMQDYPISTRKSGICLLIEQDGGFQIGCYNGQYHNINTRSGYCGLPLLDFNPVTKKLTKIGYHTLGISTTSRKQVWCHKQMTVNAVVKPNWDCGSLHADYDYSKNTIVPVDNYPIYSILHMLIAAWYNYNKKPIVISQNDSEITDETLAAFALDRQEYIQVTKQFTNYIQDREFVRIFFNCYQNADESLLYHQYNFDFPSAAYAAIYLYDIEDFTNHIFSEEGFIPSEYKLTKPESYGIHSPTSFLDLLNYFLYSLALFLQFRYLFFALKIPFETTEHNVIMGLYMLYHILFGKVNTSIFINLYQVVIPLFFNYSYLLPYSISIYFDKFIDHIYDGIGTNVQTSLLAVIVLALLSPSFTISNLLFISYAKLVLNPMLYQYASYASKLPFAFAIPIFDRLLINSGFIPTIFTYLESASDSVLPIRNFIARLILLLQVLNYYKRKDDLRALIDKLQVTRSTIDKKEFKQLMQEIVTYLDKEFPDLINVVYKTTNLSNEEAYEIIHTKYRLEMNKNNNILQTDNPTLYKQCESLGFNNILNPYIVASFIARSGFEKMSKKEFEHFKKFYADLLETGALYFKDFIKMRRILFNKTLPIDLQNLLNGDIRAANKQSDLYYATRLQVLRNELTIDDFKTELPNIENLLEFITERTEPEPILTELGHLAVENLQYINTHIDSIKPYLNSELEVKNEYILNHIKYQTCLNELNTITENIENRVKAGATKKELKSLRAEEGEVRQRLRSIRQELASDLLIVQEQQRLQQMKEKENLKILNKLQEQEQTKQKNQKQLNWVMQRLAMVTSIMKYIKLLAPDTIDVFLQRLRDRAPVDATLWEYVNCKPPVELEEDYIILDEPINRADLHLSVALQTRSHGAQVIRHILVSDDSISQNKIKRGYLVREYGSATTPTEIWNVYKNEVNVNHLVLVNPKVQFNFFTLDEFIEKKQDCNFVEGLTNRLRSIPTRCKQDLNCTKNHRHTAIACFGSMRASYYDHINTCNDCIANSPYKKHTRCGAITEFDQTSFFHIKEQLLNCVKCQLCDICGGNPRSVSGNHCESEQWHGYNCANGINCRDFNCEYDHANLTRLEHLENFNPNINFEELVYNTSNTSVSVCDTSGSPVMIVANKAFELTPSDKLKFMPINETTYTKGLRVYVLPRFLANVSFNRALDIAITKFKLNDMYKHSVNEIGYLIDNQKAATLTHNDLTNKLTLEYQQEVPQENLTNKTFNHITHTSQLELIKLKTSKEFIDILPDFEDPDDRYALSTCTDNREIHKRYCGLHSNKAFTFPASIPVYKAVLYANYYNYHPSTSKPCIKCRTCLNFDLDNCVVCETSLKSTSDTEAAYEKPSTVSKNFQQPSQPLYLE